MSKSVDRLVDEQTEMVKALISTSGPRGDKRSLGFGFPQAIHFAAETIVLSICLNLLASGIYDWAKARVMGSKRLRECRDKLKSVVADGNAEIDLRYLDSTVCRGGVREVLRRTGIPEAEVDGLAASVIEAIRASLPERISQ